MGGFEDSVRGFRVQLECVSVIYCYSLQGAPKIVKSH